MRKGYDQQVWVGENNQFIGFGLGADFCAEHEWGIRGLKRCFGIAGTEPPAGKLGLTARMISTLPEADPLVGFHDIDKLCEKINVGKNEG